MMTISELTAKWNSISPFSGGFLLVSDDNALSFHVGYAGDRQKCFMVLNSGKVDRIVSSKAIRVDCDRLTNGEYALRFLLNYPSLDELFVKLCWDLIDASSGAPDPVNKIIVQYRSWLRLLQQAGSDLMNANSQKGLLGELMFLNSAIDQYGSADALRAWTGPEGSDQDYNFSDHWAEVKAVSIAAEQVSVSSLQQLDRDDEGEFVVFFMDKTSSHGAKSISLPELIAAVRIKLETNTERDELSCKLTKYGYYDKDEDKYAEIRYQFSEQRTYRVTSDFPRLTRRFVPNGVTRAEYHLDLEVLEAFRK